MVEFCAVQLSYLYAKIYVLLIKRQIAAWLNTLTRHVQTHQQIKAR